uniref:BPTI/Kunitz inhibitor domain-containing protein n=1 Tax=Parascaris equorum TaxID=6256 RepID=A0A914S533_PAREQ
MEQHAIQIKTISVWREFAYRWDAIRNSDQFCNSAKFPKKILSCRRYFATFALDSLCSIDSNSLTIRLDGLSERYRHKDLQQNAMQYLQIVSLIVKSNDNPFNALSTQRRQMWCMWWGWIEMQNAIKNMSDYYYLNGNYQIQVIDKDLEIGGTIFEYDNHKSRGGGVAFEKLIAKGPINEELTIALLFQTGNKDSAIKYEFSVPLEQDMPFMYKPGEWSSCSVTLQTRTPFCVETATGSRVADEVCDEANSTKPETEKDCETIDCEPELYRVVYCHSVFANGKRITVDDSNCTLERPPVRQSCNRFSCPEWQAGPWSACSEKCGDAFQYRSVTCRSEKEGEEGKLLPAEACGELTIDDKRSCNLGPCEGLICGGGSQTRMIVCLNYDKKPVPEWCDEAVKPPEEQECNTHDCPSSSLSIRFFYRVMSSHVYAAMNYHLHARIASLVAAQITRHSQLSEETGEVASVECKVANVTLEAEELLDNVTAENITVHCSKTEFGCCPDWTSSAEGKDNKGCPVFVQGCERSSFPCELSTFGCCPDGETAALGVNGKGCGADFAFKTIVVVGCGCAYAQFGCCPDGKSAAKGPGYYGCPESCAQSQYGCCPDGKTISRGPNKEGCPCQYTRYGCCADGETAAMGPHSEGCDECRYAKYGCCPDGETRAVGPNFAGCPSTTVAPYLLGGTVAPEKISSCSLPQDQGTVCHPGYKLVWFYDTAEGRNDNRFATKEQCETICVEPPARGAAHCLLLVMSTCQNCADFSESLQLIEHSLR